MAGAVEEQIEDLRVRVAALRTVPKWKWIPSGLGTGTVEEAEYLAMLMRKWPVAHIADTVMEEISVLARSPPGTASTTAFSNIRKVLTRVYMEQDARDPELRVRDNFANRWGNENRLHIVLVFRTSQDNPNRGIQINLTQYTDGDWSVRFLATTAASNYVLQGVYHGYKPDNIGDIFF